jgi:hypothetical protein
VNEVTGNWRKLNGNELHKFHYSSNIIIIVKSRNEMGWAYSTNGREPSDSVKFVEFVVCLSNH